MNRSTFIVFAVLAVLLTACGAPASEAAPTATSAPVILPTDTLAPTAEALPSDTPAPSETPASAAVSFTNDVMPILQSRCFNCHGGRDTKEGLSFASYETLLAGSDNGAVVIPGDATASLIIQQLLEGKMPKRGPKLTPEQVQILIDWITAGALNN